MAQQPQPLHPLETLSAMVNLILVQTGKIFKDPTKCNSKNLVHTNAQMKQVIPSALNRFHEALDDIEIEILIAKATMERDLAAVRAKRVAREQEAAAERRRIAAETSTKEPEILANEGRGKEDKVVDEGKTDTDSLMADEPLNAEAEGDNEEPVVLEDPSLSKAEESLPSGQNPEPNPSPKHDMSSESNPKATEETHGGDAALTNTAEAVDGVLVSEAAPGDETPATAGLKDMNFESMFADLDGGGSEMNYDLDFSVPGGGDENVLGDDPFMNTIDGNDPSLIPGNSSEDINSLLPGLENYANNPSDDFGMLDNPNTSGQAENLDLNEQSSLQIPSTTTATEEVLPSESNFDDLFNSGDLVMDDENDEAGDGTLGGGSEFLDNAFFNMDGT
ncbi:MAG: hypothetical protein M1812_005471 [Candelaria pacifica]|nr:MAG: hypothetical protein M1812_005471 [Candelaria pacifica]